MPESPYADRSILVVDDVKFSRETVKTALRLHGFKTLNAVEKAEEAINLLNNEKEQTDCVIADLNMPEIHGLQFLKSVRTGKTGASRGLPFAMLTGHAERPLLKLALQFDVDAFMAKPVTADALIRHLERILAQGPSGNDELASVEAYEAIDVDSPMEHIVGLKEKSDSDYQARGPGVTILPGELNQKHLEGIEIAIADASVGSVLARDLVTERGMILLKTNATLTQRSLNRIASLAEISEIGGTLWILK